MGGLLGPVDDWAGDLAGGAADTAGDAWDVADDIGGGALKAGGDAATGAWDIADDLGGGAVDATGDVVTGAWNTGVEDPLVTGGSEANDLLGGAGSTLADWTIGTGEAAGDTLGSTVGSAAEGIGMDKILLIGVGLVAVLYVVGNSDAGAAAAESAGDLA